MTFRSLSTIFLVAFVLILPKAGAAQEPADVERGVQAFRQGNAREAIRLIGNALDAGVVSPEYRGRAHYHAAAAFVSLGDTESALPHVVNVLEMNPCVSPSAGSPPALIDLFNRNRPLGVSCQPLGTTALLKSMIVPGWGQGSKSFMISTLAAAGGAAFFLWRADDKYTAYQQSTNPLEVGSLYNKAQLNRQVGIGVGTAAAVLYVWNLIDAVSAARAHDSQISRAREIVAMPRISAGERGASLSFRIPVR